MNNLEKELEEIRAKRIRLENTDKLHNEINAEKKKINKLHFEKTTTGKLLNSKILAAIGRAIVNFFLYLGKGLLSLFTGYANQKPKKSEKRNRSKKKRQQRPINDTFTIRDPLADFIGGKK